MNHSSKKNDRRYLRTEIFITSAFVELISEKGFSAITITDIITRANIGRGTFYQHYADKQTLLKSITERILRDVETIVSVKPVFMSTAGNPKEVIIDLYTYFDDNIKTLQALLGENGDADFKKALFELIRHNLSFKEEEFARLSEVAQIPNEYRTILNDWVYNLFLVWMMTWIGNEKRESPEEFWEIMLTVSKLSHQKVFGNFLMEEKN